MAISISLPWLRGTVDGFTRSIPPTSREEALTPVRGNGGRNLEEGVNLARYPDPPRLCQLERNFDNVLNRYLRAIRPDVEVEGTFIQTILRPMSAQDASDDITTHVRRRIEIQTYLGAVDARLAQIELEKREIERSISDRTLVTQADAQTETGRVREQGD